jgi:hypothetical protein
MHLPFAFEPIDPFAIVPITSFPWHFVTFSNFVLGSQKVVEWSGEDCRNFFGIEPRYHRIFHTRSLISAAIIRV